MKNVVFGIPYSKGIKIVRALEDIGYEFHEVPGVLIDNYICNLGSDNGLKYGRYKCRKYILLQEIPHNEWSSGYHLILTDDDKTYEIWEKRYEEYLAELD